MTTASPSPAPHQTPATHPTPLPNASPAQTKAHAHAHDRRRPGIITFVVVLTYIAGVVDILLGILAIFARYLPEVIEDGYATRLTVTLVGAATVLFGLMTIALASGLARSDRVARWAVTTLLLLTLVLDVVFWITSPEQGPSAVIAQVVVCAVVILPLWLGRGGRYFASR